MSEVSASTARSVPPPVAAVEREPERPLGPVLMPPRVARALVWIALVLLLVAAVMLGRIGFDEDAGGRDLGVAIIAAAVAAGLAIGPGMAAVSGRRVASGLVMGLAVVAGGLWLRLLWTEQARGAAIISLLWVMAGVATVHLRRSEDAPRVRALRRFAVAAVFTGGGAIAAAVAAGRGIPRWFESLWGLFVGLMLFGIAAAFSVAGSRRRHRRLVALGAESLSPDVAVDFDCPGCGEPRSAARGMSRCGRCGHRVDVVIAEPRCVCGYCLYRLTGSQCAECGRRIEDAERFSEQRYEREFDEPSDAAG